MPEIEEFSIRGPPFPPLRMREDQPGTAPLPAPQGLGWAPPRRHDRRPRLHERRYEPPLSQG